MTARRAIPFALLAAASAAEIRPNVPDAHTLHLWHFEESGPPFTDLGLQPQPLAGAFNGAAGGYASWPGLGSAVSFRANAGGVPGNSDLQGAIVTAGDRLASGAGDNVPAGFRYFGEDGAFTYEAVLKFDILPGEAGVIACGLISMDGDGGDRIFNFRIEKEGFLSFIPLQDAGAVGLGLATLPSGGPHAIDTKSWFHAAVTYDGNEGVTNNLKLYWTRLAPGLHEANCIGSGTLSADLGGGIGDFAIGNEARAFPGNAEAEPFPGIIDEVRISSVARHPSDFFFVPPERRAGPAAAAGSGTGEVRRDFDLKLASVLVDASSADLPGPQGGALRLGSGLHRLDFDFGFGPEHPGGTIKLRCQLEGIDDRWQETERGMSLVCQALGKDNRVLSQGSFPFIGTSGGWETTLEDSALTRRMEPVHVPAGTTALRLSLASGSPDTTGFVTLDNLSLTAPGAPGQSLWKDGKLALTEATTRAAGVPDGWRRDGSDPAIARLVFREDLPSLALVDGDQQHHGEWSAVQAVNPPDPGGGVLVLSWDEAYNVSSGSLHRATYVNVPPGNYTFRAVGLAGDGGDPLSDGIALPIVIAPPYWQRPWFAPLLAAAAVALLAAGLVSHVRRKSMQRLESLRFQNALEQDRTRIARDLHDDLGTRVTVLTMTAALARRDLETDPERARRHLEAMTGSARELVAAMDDLVWAVDPAHDTLDHLASHLTRLAEEMFRDSEVRCRLDIPALLPARPLGAEFRHHVALAVKESLHNVLRHAGPCEVFLSLKFDGEMLTLEIRDTGIGFDPAAPPEGHGLSNTPARIREIGGSYTIDSAPGRGTSVVIGCRLPDPPA